MSNLITTSKSAVMTGTKFSVKQRMQYTCDKTSNTNKALQRCRRMWKGRVILAGRFSMISMFLLHSATIRREVLQIKLNASKLCTVHRTTALQDLKWDNIRHLRNDVDWHLARWNDEYIYIYTRTFDSISCRQRAPKGRICK